MNHCHALHVFFNILAQLLHNHQKIGKKCHAFSVTSIELKQTTYSQITESSQHKNSPNECLVKMRCRWQRYPSSWSIESSIISNHIIFDFDLHYLHKMELNHRYLSAISGKGGSLYFEKSVSLLISLRYDLF